ncbi:hypothetical protein Ahy_B08g089805 isoform C [Arachis hypogaea]|uniref:Uncharacterized protein n=1 Tax=Arachis hypogaea TaxID=3818 RepID=A0A444XYX7_ARAHY|nr:hypothetical protein Ahy_B08g089805 isoform C [Arachis hypogaea]
MSSKALNVFEGDTPTQRADSIPIDPIPITSVSLSMAREKVSWKLVEEEECFYLIFYEKKGAYSAVGVDQKRGIFTIDLLSYQ